MISVIEILYEYVKARLCTGKYTYVFIDEVQQCPDFEKAVDSLYIKKDVDVYVTGSNAHMLSGELATLLSGRYVEISMLPLSFKEHMDLAKGICYYQVAATVLDEKTLARELASLQKIPDHHPKFLLTLDDIMTNANYNGIRQINVLDWLLNVL